jgi:deazaflavin-dependent oxidoreductase (nitroreductase family)
MSRSMSRLEQRAKHALVKTVGGMHAWIYKKSGGAMGGHVVGGAPIMLLTTTGRHSGKPRTSPLIYLRDGEKFVVVASKAGLPSHPSWYLNLTVHPEVEVQIGNQRQRMLAETASADKKALYWPRLRAVYPPYQDYQTRSGRDIPVVVLRPLTNGHGGAHGHPHARS